MASRRSRAGSRKANRATRKDGRKPPRASPGLPAELSTNGSSSRRMVSAARSRSYRRLINKAASGDARAIREVFKLQAMIAEHDKSTDEKVIVNIVRWAD